MSLKGEGFTMAIQQGNKSHTEIEKAVTRMRAGGKQSPVNLMMPEEDYKKMKVKIAMTGISMKDYIVGLIQKDLEEKND